jgi:MFS family permease
MPRPEDRPLVWAIIASQFGPPFMFSGVAVALPSLGAELGAGATALGLVETGFLAGSVGFLLPVGRLADAADRRTLYKLGLLSFALTSLAIGLVSWMPAVVAIRFLQGVTSAVTAVTGPALLADLVPAPRRGRAYGASIGAIYAGLTLGPVLGGVLIDLAGWRAVFLVSAGLILAGYALVAWRMPSRWRRAPGAIHLPSAVLVVAAAVTLVAGSATLDRGPLGYLLIAAGVALSVGFVALQRRLPRPLLDVGAVARNLTLARALLVQALLYVNAFSSIFLLSIYMQVTLGHPARTAGLIVAIGSVLMAVIAPVAGILADRRPPHRLARLGVVAVLVSTILITTLDDGSSLGFVALILVVQGAGYALFSTPNMSIIMGSVGPEQASMASALGAKARSLGMLGGMLITAIVITLHLGDAPVGRHPLAFVAVLATACGVLAALVGLALIASFGRTAAAAPAAPVDSG